MINFFETVKEGLHFNKFELNDTICVEYTCPIENEQRIGLCSQSDYLVYILSGKKTWKTIHGEWTLEAGSTIYVKKGATLINQFFEDEFCVLAFFISDDLIQESVIDIIGKMPLHNSNEAHQFTATEVATDNYLEGYFQSMLTYFRRKQSPSDYLLKLKLKELLVNVICGNENRLLASYLKSVACSGKPSLPHIMESNFCYNLKMEDFAKLCHRSLSTFKRDFHNHYNTTPGKWLLSKRLHYAANLVRNNFSGISQIAFESGFEDVSHFSRVFKDHFGLSPTTYRKIHSGHTKKYSLNLQI